jgi:hypothetical protein
MSDLHNCLVEFPSPQPDEEQSAGTTNISPWSRVAREWKANHAMRDNTLVQKLCSALERDTRRMPRISSYRGFHLGYSSGRLAGKAPIGQRTQAKYG